MNDTYRIDVRAGDVQRGDVLPGHGTITQVNHGVKRMTITTQDTAGRHAHHFADRTQWLQVERVRRTQGQAAYELDARLWWACEDAADRYTDGVQATASYLQGTDPDWAGAVLRHGRLLVQDEEYWHLHRLAIQHAAAYSSSLADGFRGVLEAVRTDVANYHGWTSSDTWNNLVAEAVWQAKCQYVRAYEGVL